VQRVSGWGQSDDIELIPYRDYANVGQAFVVNLREKENARIHDGQAVRSRALH